MGLKVMPVFFNMARRNAGAILDAIRDLMPEHAEVTDEALLDTWEDVKDTQKRAAVVDVLLELSENLRPVPIRFFLRLGDYGLAIILFDGEFHLAPRRLEAAGYWKSRGNKLFLPLALVEELGGTPCMALVNVLRDYHGRGLGVTAAWNPRAGQDVTLARFDTSLRELVFTKGRLVGHGED